MYTGVWWVRDYIEDPGIRRKIILKYMLKDTMGNHGLESSCPGSVHVVRSLNVVKNLGNFLTR